MKKIFLTTAIAALLSVNVFAADGVKKVVDGGTNVSYIALHGFTVDFSDAKDVNWTVTKNCQKATFTIDGVKKTAFYNLNGEFLGVTQRVDAKAIPAKTLKQIAKDYKGYEIGEVIVYQANTDLNDNIDPTSYFVDLKNDTHEVLVRITQQANLEFFQQVR
ncbi:hypothetical protein [Mucilaginibacter sp. SG564]|uniref:hypothetical protein n=1 Tax=unclassified Mucilaginibacter TaxID=2617802 RepID=UPI0015532EFE|nr:hypothetical protein [Mucilaginibacter sp. SG564]NOW93835.1 opacity protein-like surface antigen [Mucilaginibacter sp. SG564]